jgi:hypothetical protein
VRDRDCACTDRDNHIHNHRDINSHGYLRAGCNLNFHPNANKHRKCAWSDGDLHIDTYNNSDPNDHADADYCTDLNTNANRYPGKLISSYPDIKKNTP